MLTKIIFLGSLSLFGVFAFAGSESSGGGAIFVTRNSAGKVPGTGLPSSPNVELLDLWEGRTLYKYNYDRAWSADHSTLKERALDRLDQFDPQIRASAFYYQELQKMPAPAGAVIAAPSDTNHPFVKPGAKLEGLGYWDDLLDELYYVLDLYLYMYPLDQIAFDFHESIYKYFRETLGLRNSTWSRKVVAKIFSEGEILSPNDGVPDGALFCSQHGLNKPWGIDFYLFREDKSINVQITRMESFRPIEPLVIKLDGLNPGDTYHFFDGLIKGELKPYKEVVLKGKSKVDRVKITFRSKRENNFELWLKGDNFDIAPSPYLYSCE